MPIQLLIMIASAIYNRSREPSTHAGLSGLALALVPFLPDGWGPVAQAIAGLFGALAVSLAEKGGAAAAGQKSDPLP